MVMATGVWRAKASCITDTGLVVLGIDLAGSPKRPTGVCVMADDRAQTHLAFSDADLVPIDAPLSLPPGRRSIHFNRSTTLPGVSRSRHSQRGCAR